MARALTPAHNAFHGDTVSRELAWTTPIAFAGGVRGKLQKVSYGAANLHGLCHGSGWGRETPRRACARGLFPSRASALG
jgi:hypothetical protein